MISAEAFRVEVDARNSFESEVSDPVYLPLNEWINIQVTLSTSGPTQGITIMTFNQNGERLQLVYNGARLAE